MTRLKLPLALTVFVVLGLATAASAQSLLSVMWSAGGPLVRIDPATGAVTPLMNTKADQLSFGTFDPIHRRLFLLDGIIGTQKLVITTLNARTSTSIPVPASNAYTFFEYDPVTDRILSVMMAPGFPLVAINPNDGTVETLLLTNAQPDFGFSAFDPVSRRLFYLNGVVGAQSIVTVDLAKRMASGWPIFRSSPYVFFEYDPVTDRVLSVVSEPGVPVVSIDPTNGHSQTLFNTGAPNANFGLNAIDVTGRRLFFLSNGVGNQVLITADLAHASASGTFVNSPIAYLLFEYESAESVAAAPALGTIGLIVLAAALAVIALTASGSGRM
jgi:hypothetical protein